MGSKNIHLSHSHYFLEALLFIWTIGTTQKDQSKHRRVSLEVKKWSSEECSWLAGFLLELMLFTVIVWSGSLLALSNAMFPHQERNFSVHLLPLPWGGGNWVIFELSSWYNSAVQPMEQTELVKGFPARNVPRIVLPYSLRWFLNPSCCSENYSTAKIYSQAYSHLWHWKRR